MQLKRIDYNKLLESFFSVYGEQAVWYILITIFFFFSLFLTYVFIRHRGWITTPQERLFKSITNNTKDIKDSLTKLTELSDIIIRNQRSKLTHEQVNNIIDAQLYIYKNRFIDIIMEIYVRNHIKNNKEKTLKKMKNSFEVIIREEDNNFFSLPNVEGSVIPTDLKIKSFVKEDIYDEIFNIMLNNSEAKTKNCFNEVHRQTTTLIHNFILNNWKTR